MYLGEFSKYSRTLQSWDYSNHARLPLCCDAHWVDGCEEHRLPLFLETLPPWVVRVPNVVDVLDEVVWQWYFVLQCGIDKGASRMALKCSKTWKMFRWVGVRTDSFLDRNVVASSSNVTASRHVVAIWSSISTTPDKLCRIFLVLCLSISSQGTE